MDVKEAYELFKAIKLYVGKNINITYYKKVVSWQLIDNEWKSEFAYEKKTESVTLCEINTFRNILVESEGTKIGLPFFGMDCIIRSISSSNNKGEEIPIYTNQYVNEESLNVGNDKSGEEIKKKMFLSDDIDQLIEELVKKEKESKSANNPLLNGLFDRHSLFEYGTRDRIFPFTNEMLNLFMPAFSFEDKVVLANLGGGDFALNSYLLGAKHVDNFDINEYSYYFYELKKALIKFYSYEDFLSIIENPIKVVNNFNEYKHLLKDDVAKVIGEMLQKYSECLIGFAKKLFLPAQFNANDQEFTTSDLKSLRRTAQFRNFYLSSEENYNIVRNYLLRDIDRESQFILGDIMKSQIHTKYDLIYLSNIGDSIEAKQYADFLFFLQNNLLTDDGQIIIVDKAQKFGFLAESEFVAKVEYDTSRIDDFNAANIGFSSISDSEKKVDLYRIGKQPIKGYKKYH